MPISALNAVLIDTRDVKRLVAFYRDRLGLPLREESHGSAPHWGCFLAGLHFAVHEERDAAQSSRVAISFAVDDVDQAIAELRQGGVTIVEEPVDRPYGRLASVRDPDGNLVYLHKNPTRG
jgi:predicted enzyme related to lactoylglutathione lyase